MASALTDVGEAARAPQRVPRVIHQVWMQGAAALPPRYAELMRGWRDAHPPPAWRHELWDEHRMAALIASRKGAEEAARWLSIPKLIQRADLGRCYVLEAHGGVYLDMDTRCLAPLDPLLREMEEALHRDSDAAAARWPPLLCVGANGNNAVIISSPENPFWTAEFFPSALGALFGGEQHVSFPRALVASVNQAARIAATTGPWLWDEMLVRLAPHARWRSPPAVHFQDRSTLPPLAAHHYGLVLAPNNLFYSTAPGVLRRQPSLTPAQADAMREAGALLYHAHDGTWFTAAELFVSRNFPALIAAAAAVLLLALVAAATWRRGRQRP